MYLNKTFTFIFRESPSADAMPDTESATITIDEKTDGQIDKQMTDRQAER
jgi:hypothetical protein